MNLKLYKLAFPPFLMYLDHMLAKQIAQGISIDFQRPQAQQWGVVGNRGVFNIKADSEADARAVHTSFSFSRLNSKELFSEA